MDAQLILWILGRYYSIYSIYRINSIHRINSIYSIKC